MTTSKSTVRRKRSPSRPTIATAVSTEAAKHGASVISTLGVRTTSFATSQPKAINKEAEDVDVDEAEVTKAINNMARVRFKAITSISMVPKVVPQVEPQVSKRKAIISAPPKGLCKQCRLPTNVFSDHRGQASVISKGQVWTRGQKKAIRLQYGTLCLVWTRGQGYILR